MAEREGRLVAEWLALAARAGVRPPPELVPELLSISGFHGMDVRAVLAAAGPLAAWLGERNPALRLARVPAGDPDDVWAHGDTTDRSSLLEHLLATDPERGRALLASTFSGESVEDRKMFLIVLAGALSEADEPLLEAALDDPRAEVRGQAALLLRRLPLSRFAARMADRARPLLHEHKGTLHVTLPGEPDAAARRDGLNPKDRRSTRLTELLAAAPLETWPVDWAALPAADDLAGAVRAGWVQAARLQEDEAWARELWRVVQDPDLLVLLPRQEAERRALGADDPFAAALELQGTWGPLLSRAVLALIPKRRELGLPVLRAAYHLDRTLEAEVEALRELGGRELLDLCDTYAVRAAMLRELA